MVNQRHRYVYGQRLDKIEGVIKYYSLSESISQFEQGVSLSGVYYSLISVNYFVKFNKITDCLRSSNLSVSLLPLHKYHIGGNFSRLQMIKI